jgi:mRNA interferase HicA
LAHRCDVKRKDLIRRIEELGVVLVRQGGGHAIYENPFTKDTIAVPRHAEVNEPAKSIIRKASVRTKKPA